MSLEAVAWALRQAVGDPVAKLILISIADHHNATTGECFPGQKRLAEAGCCSSRTVIRKLAWLTAHGWISVVHRHDRDGRQTSNGYAIRAMRGEGDRLSPSGCHVVTHEGDRAVSPSSFNRKKNVKKANSSSKASGARGSASPWLEAPDIPQDRRAEIGSAMANLVKTLGRGGVQ